ncbi:MAG: class I SAM-dependent methyltransferase [Micromonosporaceae bacterium]|nr:class I SAM-dependent methyltransferase [Micromonosporaceae bacterium]
MAAALYDRARPPYPEEAVRWMLEPAGHGSLRVVDLGAGTGILTRALLRLGHEVRPIEPDPGMCDRLAELSPAIEPLPGTAEAMPVPDAWADAVVAGQAYHWFDVDRAHPEIARVLRPGGALGLVWNDRDEGISWLAELTVLANGLAGRRQSVGHNAPTSIPPWFGPVEHEVFRHSVAHTVDSLIELIMSRSYYLTASPQQQEKIVRAVRTLASEHPDLEHRSTFELPYRAQAYRATRLFGDC